LRIKKGWIKGEEMREEKLKSEPRLIVWINRRDAAQGEWEERRVITRESDTQK
jgi:hypothetical protein